MLPQPDLVEPLLVRCPDHVHVLEQERMVAPPEVVDRVHEHAETHGVGLP